jgi:tetrahydromethanopterin S-methyltransferase subunit B
MSGVSKKALGMIMIAISALGFLLSIFLLFQVWHYRQPVTNSLQTGLDQSSVFLQTTSDGLTVIDQVVNNVYTTTFYLDDATNAIAETMHSTSQFMDSAGTFVGVDLINTITNTQIALDSAQASAVVIDNILSALSNIPLIGITYNPTTPLNQALGEVSTSLDPVQASLKNFQTNLENTKVNIQILNEQITTLDTKIITINSNLSQAQTTINSYQSQVDSLKISVERAKLTLSTWISTLAWILTAIILWLLLVQIGILLQGISFIAQNHLTQEESG